MGAPLQFSERGGVGPSVSYIHPPTGSKPAGDLIMRAKADLPDSRKSSNLLMHRKLRGLERPILECASSACGFWRSFEQTRFCLGRKDD